MRVRIILLLLALLVPRPAAADRVGVVVLGDALAKQTREAAAQWLRDHNQQVAMTALPAEAVKTLSDCFLVDDPKCARSVIEARAATTNVIAIRVEMTSKKTKDVRITIDWFVKGHSPVSSRRSCDACTDATLRTTLEAMLSDLAKSKPGMMGRIKVDAPPGLSVLVDGATIGVTPLEQSIVAGEHKVRLAQDGRMGEEKVVTVAADGTTEVELPAPPPVADPVVTTKSSRVVPGVMIGIGLAGIGAGAALYLTSEEPTGTNRTYRDTKKLGLGVAGGGAALALAGVIIILATGGDSGPTVAMTPDGGAAVGWVGRF